MTLLLRTLSGIVMLALLSGNAPALQVEVAKSQSINAPAIDAGDYYLDVNGNPIRFYRKQDIYLNLESIAIARTKRHQGVSGLAADRASPSYRGPRNGFDVIENHRWGALEIIKDTRPQAAQPASGRGPATAMPASLAPVFSGPNGRGEFLILPDIMIAFNSKEDVQRYKNALLDRFSMQVANQMMFSDTHFVLRFNAAVDGYSKVFSTTRELMALPYIKWAEPNMLVKLEKTETPDPNDILFREQWGLHNWGENGGFCDANTNVAADIDADDAWTYMDSLMLPNYPQITATGKPVIAIIDDGIKLNHADLPIWTNPNPSNGNFGGGTNICLEDINGCNFGDFYLYGGGTGRTYNRTGPDTTPADGGTLTPPSPQTSADTHGTLAAGIAAAKRNNSSGITGSAYDAEILPIRLDFNSGTMDCIALLDSLSYAAKYADVISNSWRLNASDKAACSTSLNIKLSDIANGDPAFARGTKGTPVLFASGNSAAGWRRISVDGLTAGVHTIQLAFHKDNPFFATDIAEDAVWIDDISLPANTLPGATFFDFSGAALPTGFDIKSGANSPIIQSGNIVDYNACNGTSTGETPLPGSSDHTIGGTGNAIKLSPGNGGGYCEYLEISVSLTEPGSLRFWAWVSAEPWLLNSEPRLVGDPFRVYIDGIKTSVDLINAASDSVDKQHNSLNEQFIYDNELEYPASHPDVIAVGASNDGSDAQMEDRAYFSQYGSTLDVLAPGTAIRTTSSNGGYDYLSGTSASTPMVAGVITNMLAINPDLTLNQIKDMLHGSADKIGPIMGEFAYADDGSGLDFNKYYGYGRVNSYQAVQLADGVANPVEAPELCTDPNPGAADDDFLLLLIPGIISAGQKAGNHQP